MKSIINKYDKNIIISNRYNDFINIEIAKLMLEHLEFVKVKPRNILLVYIDQNISANIKKAYPYANVIYSDLTNLISKDKFYKKGEYINDNSVDIVIINISIPWYNNFLNVLNEIKRVSKKNTIFIFSSINSININNFFIYNKTIDVYNMGSILLKCKLKNIAMDNIVIKMQYNCYKTFFLDIMKSKTFCLGNINLKKVNIPINCNFDINFGYAVL